MLLLLGFLALRLLSAAIFGLLYLLLAPAMVLAPAFGEAGRGLFRRWAAQLLGAIVAKLLFSFLLGVLLALLGVLANLEALGWWTQWLLMSAMWWGAFARRHHAIGVTGGEQGAGRRSLAGRVSSVLRPPLRVVQGAREEWRERKEKAERARARTAASAKGTSPSEERAREAGSARVPYERAGEEQQITAPAGSRGAPTGERLPDREHGKRSSSPARQERIEDPSPSPPRPIADEGEKGRGAATGGEAERPSARERSPRPDRPARETPEPRIASERGDFDPLRASRESELMRDIREVEAGRKRQLGFGRD
jgi:hypothetical protein